jgi:CheY-like chemotaxis protein
VQCLGNILANAVKYTEPGGRISIRTRGDESDAFVEVADNGGGIAPELMPRIFDLFVQSESTLDRAEGGLGVGLAVVKRVVEMHEGEVRAHSDGLRKGSTFQIRLPRVARPGAATSEMESTNAEPRRVLIVDDNADAADSLAMLLQALNHDTRVAYNGMEALACVEAFKPQTGLIDIGLPGMNGYEVAKRMRAMPNLSGLRLIALTGYGQPEDYERSKEAGFDDHLVKPVDLSALDRALDGAPR